MSVTEYGLTHSIFSVNRSMVGISTIQDDINRGYTDACVSLTSYEQRLKCQPHGDTMCNLSGCRPGSGADGCNTNNTCTSVHGALSGQVSCLSCSFTMGQYSSLDFNDLCFYHITNNAICPPPGLGYSVYDGSQVADQHEPYGQHTSISDFSLSFSVDCKSILLQEGGEQIPTTSDETKNTRRCNTGSKVNDVNQMENAIKTGTQVVAMREFGFIPAAITKQIYFSSNNPYIECEDKALYLSNLHSAVKNHGCSNYKGARIPVPSGLNIKAWRHILRDYDIVNLVKYLEFRFPLGVDYSLFQFKKI